MENKKQLECWFTGVMPNIRLDGVRNPTMEDFNTMKELIYVKGEDIYKSMDKIFDEYLENNKM